MSPTLNRKQIGDGIHISWIRDPKFKHNRIAIHCLLPLTQQDASVNAMIPLMLRLGSKNLPDFSKLNAQLNRLYGASLNGDTSKFNRWQIVTLGISSLDNRYAMEQEDLSALCTDLLLDFFLSPNLDKQGDFLEKEFALEQQFLLDTIEAEINEKRSYAIQRMAQEMFGRDSIAISQYGSLESARNATAKNVADAWRQMLRIAPIEILFTGTGEPDSAIEKLEQAFAALDRAPLTLQYVDVSGFSDHIKEITEPIEGIQQGKLVMGFRTRTLVTPQEQYAARMFSALFGATPFSKLFLNVREKLSLCYYCASRFDVINQFMTVDSGVEAANKKKTIDEVLVQLRAVQGGDITSEELENIKKLAANSILSTNDSLRALEGWYLNQILRGQNLSPEQDIALLQQVTAEEIIQVAQGLSLDTVYFLTEKEEA